MRADVHIRIFLAAFAAVLEHGMGSAPNISATRVVPLNQGLNAILTISPYVDHTFARHQHGDRRV